MIFWLILISDLQSSKLNPGAPEFTPRTFRATQLALTPIHNSWAEDVEDEVAPSQKAIGSIILNPVKETHPDHTRVPPNTVAALPEPLSRRNTLQTVSCPEPPPHSLRGSPTRSVSQPMPSPQVTTPPPKEDMVPETQQKATAEPDEKPVESKPTVSEVKPPQGASRGRGSRSRGGHRGRYRGRGRRNPSNSKQNQDNKTTSAPQPAAQPDSHTAPA